MKLSNKIFTSLALILVLTLTYSFTFTNNLNFTGTVLGEKDTIDSSFDSLTEELDASLEELDIDVETEIETEIETKVEEEAETEQNIKTEKTVENQKQDIIIAPTTENKLTTRKSSKIERLFFVLPVEIKTEIISDKGVVVEENKTLIGKILDFLSY